MFNKEAFLEAFKEMMRVAVLAVIPVAVEGLTQNQLNLRLVGVTAVIAALRFVDSILHEMAKDQPKKDRNEGYLGVKGITGF